MRYLFVFLLSIFAFGQKKEVKDILKFQKDLNAEYKNPKESPLRGERLADFQALPFFNIDLKYRVPAKLERTKDAEVFELPTSSGKTKKYKEYGTLSFTLNGEPYSLKVYQSQDLINKAGFEDHLFLPFRDNTNEVETYGGGRYIDLKIPKKNNEMILDFNKAYNPYCAYNAFDYNCPIVPLENKLPVKIRAGIKYEDIYH
ncbi:hypothetical protein BAX97_07925 [Elizabethkingia meningoseptica]|uniref:DUF1684 domain-containing protein n=1 Tax=Elizabethkingia meningoseptica TaxID=238 RepID=A0A1V3U0N1_ELIME|nr:MULTISPECIES: DUF1684 domain-containing protein [Elizabethkingia]AQX06524.1 hypothetical protein BBD33_15215 [Elizabethkingia meningoseptica]AQX14056.1 hypothetical protein BBD35_17515 [Elizabethkingia meningoseptica]AQX48571.1 hypothetical protein B5G46_15210 [Elizabethkingia meningoseptica]EOR29579.1 hypothetical protein L100_10464 [Elizabethkingia meningoseptica ATCC 13253 = NBRC 12535]KUY13624.1 hypothetical protein ATB99_13820 [Elizabethkingia meningoseptica]